MVLPGSRDTVLAGRHIRVEAFLTGAFIATVFVWSISAVLTLLGIIIGGGTLPPRTPFLAAHFIYDFAKLPVTAGLVVAIGAVALLRTRRYSMRHRYAMIWIFATAYVVVSALLAYARALLEGAGMAAPLAAAVFLSWGALIAYGYAALVAAALAIAEKLSIVSSPRME
jgi:hypothetical protein